MSPALRPAALVGGAMVLLGMLLLLHALGVLPGGVPVGSLFVIALGVAISVNATKAAQAGPAPAAAAPGEPAVAGEAPAAAVSATMPVMVDLNGATSARVVLNHGAGTLHVRGGGAPRVLVEGMATAPVEWRATPSGDRLDVTLQPGSEWQRWPLDWQTLRWDLALTADVPLDLEVATGASQVRLDLTGLQVRSLRLKTGASDVDVTLPAHGHCRMSVSAGAANIRIRVPQGVAATVRNRSALAGFAIDEERFPRINGRHESPGFGTAADQVEIDVDGGVASFAVM